MVTLSKPNTVELAARPATAPTPPYEIRHIGRAELVESLRQGLADFNASPTFAIFLCVIYPVVGLLLARATFSYGLIPLLFPAIAGFALLGPFAAIGLYEISRLHEDGQPVTWRKAFGVIHAKSFVAILALGAILVGIFSVWMVAADAIYVAFFGDDVPQSLTTLVQQILTTRAGWEMMILGNVVGALFAITAFAISVVSFPLLIDRNTDAATAVATSLRAVTANPVAMVQWGLIVAVALVLGSIPLLVGLAVVMPVLGHATWHLYRKMVV